MFLLEAIGLTLNVNDRTVMEQSVEDGHGDDGVAEDFAPLAEALV